MEPFVDPVVEEVRERGRRVTARYGNDPVRIMQRLREIAKQNEDRVVDRIVIIKSEPPPPVHSA